MEIIDSLSHSPVRTKRNKQPCDVYSDHGRNCQFQEQYGNIAIDKLEWMLIERKANQLLRYTAYPFFKENWIVSVSHRINDFNAKGWSCADVRSNIVEQWKRKRTWLLPPYFIAGAIIQKESAFHLMEGHTRLGILQGLVDHGIVEKESVHIIWYGYMP